MAGEQVQGPSVDESRRLLFEEIHAPVFFQKLAEDYQIHPRTPQEQQQLLDMGAHLFAEDQAEQEKKAAAQTSPIAGAYNGLFQALGERGVPSPAVVQRDFAIKEAAARLARNPDVMKAALTFASSLG